MCVYPHRIKRWHGTFRSDTQFHRPCLDIEIVVELYVTGVTIVKCQSEIFNDDNEAKATDHAWRYPVTNKNLGTEIFFQK